MPEKRKVKPVPLFLDNPVDKDTLGVEQLAYTIAGAAIGNPGPFTIGVFGGWGKGKTSVLKITRSILQDKESWPNPVTTVWFNAWQHEREEHPLFSLIAAIVDGLEKESESLIGDENSLAGKAKEGFRKAALSLRALTRGMKFSGKIGIPLIGDIGAEFDAGKALVAEELLGKQNHPLMGELLYHKAFEGLSTVTERFREELSEIDSGVHANVVVFIDDLDRCNPERALHLLEGIKLILSQPGFVFIMGIDRNIIEKYLEFIYDDKYKIVDENRGQKYLDKMVQLALNLPHHGKPFEEHLAVMLENLKVRATGSEKLSAFLQIINENRDVIIANSNGNPRALVRLLNGFLVDCQHWGENEVFKTEDIAVALIFHRLLEAQAGETLLDQIVGNEEFWLKLRNGKIGEILAIGEDDILSTHSLRLIQDKEAAKIFIRNPELLDLVTGKAIIYAESQELRRCIRQMDSQFSGNHETVEVPIRIVRQVKSSLGVHSKSEITRKLLERCRYLDVEGVDINGEEIQFIVTNMPNIEHIDLDKLKLAAEELHVLLRGIPLAKSISMCGWNITIEVMRSLVTNAEMIRHLRLSSSTIDSNCIKLLCESATGIRELHMSQIPTLGDQDLLQIIDNLKDLEVVSLTGSGITDNGGKLFARGMPSLSRLILGVEGISDDCIPELIRGLPNLNELSLSASQVTDKGVELLGELCPNLRMLALSGAKVTEASLSLIDKGFPELETLWIANGSIPKNALADFRLLRPDIKVF